MKRFRAFTLVELMFVIGTLVLAMLVIPALTRPTNRNCGRLRCPSNLKQIGLAFRMWANDHGDKFPMQVSIAEDGAKELAEQGFALPSFASISNELNNPKPLHCPQDFERERATRWEQLAVTNLSYFMSLEASETNPASILAGDRNVCIGGQLATQLARIQNPKFAAWGVRIHTNRGNVVLSDGSAHQLDDLGLRTALTNSSVATNHFIFP
jgi:competence protein ComGC